MLAVRQLAIAVEPYYASRADYNNVGRVPYYAACLFTCAAGALDPLGLKALPLFDRSGRVRGIVWLDVG